MKRSWILFLSLSLAVGLQAGLPSIEEKTKGVYSTYSGEFMNRDLSHFIGMNLRENSGWRSINRK